MLLQQKKVVKSVRDEVTKLKVEVDKLTEMLKDIKKENEELTATCPNNLKYLVNHDRNVRRPNIILFGLSEVDAFVINEENIQGDKEKTY